MSALSLSRHAVVRAQQRGVTHAQIEAVMIHADMASHRGRGVEALWISREKLSRLGPTTPEGVDCDRLKNLIVLAVAAGVGVTVLRDPAKTYRRRARIWP